MARFLYGPSQTLLVNSLLNNQTLGKKEFTKKPLRMVDLIMKVLTLVNCILSKLQV